MIGRLSSGDWCSAPQFDSHRLSFASSAVALVASSLGLANLLICHVNLGLNPGHFFFVQAIKIALVDRNGLLLLGRLLAVAGLHPLLFELADSL